MGIIFRGDLDIMKVAVLANLMEDAPVSPDDPPGRWDDLDSPKTIQAVRDSISSFGYEARYFPADISLVNTLPEYQPDICFNMGEGHFGASRESQVPALLDMLHIPYTGSGVLGMYLSHNKHIAKRMFEQVSLPTARFFVVDEPGCIPTHDLRFPLFVKPAHEGSSIGINKNALVHNQADLLAQIQWVWNETHSTILIEEYIQGREFTIGVLGKEVLPIVEIVSPTGFYSREQKEDEHSSVYRVCPAELSPEKTAQFQHIAVQAMQTLDLVDLCRMDLRMDASGHPFILEVNPLPLMNPDPEQASYVYASRAVGYDYPEMIHRILLAGLRRWKIPE
jgi:D-alanine-D-alanine ligase